MMNGKKFAQDIVEAIAKSHEVSKEYIDKKCVANTPTPKVEFEPLRLKKRKIKITVKKKKIFLRLKNI